MVVYNNVNLCLVPTILSVTNRKFKEIYDNIVALSFDLEIQGQI